jgi:hypothetical protein
MVVMDPELLDQKVRNAAFGFLSEKTAVLGDTLPWSVLIAGFEFQGQRVPLVGPQGIFELVEVDLNGGGVEVDVDRRMRAALSTQEERNPDPGVPSAVRCSRE